MVFVVREKAKNWKYVVQPNVVRHNRGHEADEEEQK